MSTKRKTINPKKDPEELHDLARKRQGGLDIPEWKVDESMNECVKCGYSLRPGWSRCPVCETPVDAKPKPEPTEEPAPEPEPTEEPAPEPSEEPKELPIEEIKEEPSEEVEEDKEDQ